MGDIFLKLLNMSITAGWFILAVLCIRLIFRKIPKWVNCLLWGSVAIRLLCPFPIESSFSLLPSAEPVKSSTMVEGEIQSYIPSIDSHLTIVENTINPMLSETFAYNEAESAAPLQVVTYAAGIIWVCGMIYWFQPLCWAAYAMLCKDIELACDEKAAKDMAFHEKKEYSKILLSCTKQRSLVMVCPLAFGEVGIKERVKAILNYKKPSLWIIIAALAVCVLLGICFLTNPEKDISSQAEEMPAEGDSVQEIYKHAQEIYEQPEADKVCIKIQPSMIREQAFYYYIPTDKDQKWLSERVKELNLEGEPWDRRWEGHKERGWQIVYNDIEIRAFEGGYLYYTYDDDEKGMMECFIEAPKLCDYIQVMLTEKIGYQNYDVSDIKDIVSAKLDVNSLFTGGEFYSQIITDAETLLKFEDWFSNAEYFFGGADCGNQCACLELTLAKGDVVRLSMATDSCPNFSLDGVAYDYRPVSDWDNSEFFKCFDEIPWEY